MPQSRVAVRRSSLISPGLLQLLVTFSASALASLLVTPAPAFAETPTTWPERGYQARGCGFDMNRNGIFGEPADCRVCDGVTADPDGDTVNEDIFYVDCDGGANSINCGSPGSPCRTIEWAWNTRADGIANGVEDIICFRGTCRTLENFNPQSGGLPGHYVVPATGSQERDWQYPRNPAMLVGWDFDGDGIYPPVDPGEASVLDGSGLSRTFRLDSDTDYLEMGHFTVRNYGIASNEDDSGFVRFGPSSGFQTHQYFHDLKLNAINRDRRTSSETILINFFPTNSYPQWMLFANLEVLNNGQWFARGAGYDPEPGQTPETAPNFGPLRFINISQSSHSCDFAVCGGDAGATAFKLWGYMQGIEILDSIWDANVAAWQPKPTGGPPGSSFVFVDVCTRDWLVRNNEVIDHKVPFRIKGFSQDACVNNAARAVDDVVFDSNYVYNTYQPWATGDHGVRIEPGGNSARELVEDVWITNNVMSSAHGWEAAIWSYAGHDSLRPTGTITIANNTFYGDINRHAAIVLGHVEGTDQTFPHTSYVIENNIFGGFEPVDGVADLAIHTTFPVVGVGNIGGLQSNYNVFPPGSLFRWNDGGRGGLSFWRNVSGQGLNSRLCEVALENVNAGDFSLRSTDVCALNSGTSTGSTPVIDLDGNLRPEGARIDVGADELVESLFCDGFEQGDAGAWTLEVP